MATRTFIGLRHGNAVPAVDTGDARADDLARVLSQKGLMQAAARNEQLERIHFDVYCCSPAKRALQTLAAATGTAQAGFRILRQLYTPEGPDGELLDQLFAELGDVPLSAYLEHVLNKDDDVVQTMAYNAGVAICETLDRHDQTIAVCGHVVYTPLAVGFAAELIMGTVDQDLRDFVCDLNLAELGAFRVTVETGQRGADYELFD